MIFEVAESKIQNDGLKLQKTDGFYNNRYSKVFEVVRFRCDIKILK